MASELIYSLIRFGFLALLWIFVFVTLGVLRRDVFGQSLTRRRGRNRGRKRQGRRPRKGGRVGEPRVLVVTGGPQQGTTLQLGTSAIRVGRSNACNLVLDDSYASSQHARFYKSDGDWYVEDLASTNGTFIDGERLVAPRRVEMGIQVRIGQTTMELSR